MNSIFDKLIMPSKRTYAVDLISGILTGERDNQIKIAKSAGKNPAWIEQNIYFKVNNHELRGAEIFEMPSVFVYFNRTDYASHQTMSKLPSTNQLVMELFASGVNKEDLDGNIVISADAYADYRLEYLQSQVVQIMMSEAAENIRKKAGITSTIIKSVERTYSPEKDNIAESVMSSKIIFEIEFDEYTKYLAASQVKEIYIQNHIGESLVSILLDELN